MKPYSSSGHSESDASSGNETEEGEVKARHLLAHRAQHAQRIPKVWVKIQSHPHRPRSSSTEGQRSEGGSEDDSNCSSVCANSDASPTQIIVSPHTRKLAAKAALVQMQAGQKENIKMRIVKNPVPKGKALVKRAQLMSRLAERKRKMAAAAAACKTARLMAQKPGIHIRHRQGLQLGQFPGRYRRCHEVSDDDEEIEGEEDEEEFSDDEIEIAKHMKVVPMPKSRRILCAAAAEEDDEEEEEEEEEEDDDDDESSEYTSAESDQGCQHGRHHVCGNIAAMKRGAIVPPMPHETDKTNQATIKKSNPDNSAAKTTAPGDHSTESEMNTSHEDNLDIYKHISNSSIDMITVS